MTQLYRGMQNPANSFLLIGTDEEVAEIQAELKGQGIAPRIQSVSPDAWSDSSLDLENVAAVCCVPGALKPTEVSALFRSCQEKNIMLYFCVPGLGVLQKNMQVKNVGFLSFLSPLDEPLSYWWNRLLKRLFDLLVSGAFLFFVFPFIYIAAAIAIKRKSAGPVFSRIKEMGKGGKVFERLTFRTADLPAGSFFQGAVMKSLPQFLNVFMGSMSVVGLQLIKGTEEPMPSIYNYVKPGLVKCQFCKNADVWYVQNWSLCLDFRILIKALLNKNKIE